MANNAISDPEHNGTNFWNTISNEKILDSSVITELREIGGDELVITLFETFISDSYKFITQLEAASSGQDMMQFDYIIHSLKGTSGSIGANKMYLLAGYINEFSRNRKWPDNSSWLQVLKNIYAETIVEMKNQLHILAHHSS